MNDRLKLAFVPLTDAAPLVIAKELGFDAEESLSLELKRANSWSSVRDMLVFESVDAAHMLAPMPVAMHLGLGGVRADISALMVLSLNGTVIGVKPDLEQALRAQGFALDFSDAGAAGQALAQVSAGQVLRIGVPFPFSTHALLVDLWMRAAGFADADLEIRTVPPPLMVDAMRAGEIDMFCVGEPWGSLAVEAGQAALLLPGRSIWSAAPEKVLAARTGWAEEVPDLAGRLMRTIWRASRWLAAPGSLTTAAEILSRSTYLDLSTDVVDRALNGRFVLNARGDLRRSDPFMTFFEGAANFPWRSQAMWIGARLALRHGLEVAPAATASAGVFRSDLYRTHLGQTAAVMPGASAKIEGGITGGTAAGSATGRLFLAENLFFDGSVFDPMDQTIKK